jgi:hypothetical protein
MQNISRCGNERLSLGCAPETPRAAENAPIPGELFDDRIVQYRVAAQFGINCESNPFVVDFVIVQWAGG